MAFSPIAFTVPEYDKTLFRNWWLKAYEPGTTTAKSMAVDAAGSSQASRFQIDSEGFPVTAGDALVIPYVNGSYDLWLFPTAAEADANDTTNARQFADNVTIPETPNFTEEVADLTNINFATVAALKADTTVKVGDFVTIESYTATNDSGVMFGKIVAAGTGVDDGGSYIDLPTSGLQFKQNLPTPCSVKLFGAEGDGANDDLLSVQNAIAYTNDVLFPSGEYAWSVSPDFSFDDLVLTFGEGVKLKHLTGSTGFVVDIDAGAVTGNVYNITMNGRPNIECAASSDGPFRARSVHHSKLMYEVVGSPTDCGRVQFAVLSEIDVIASVNHAAFLSQPVDGLVLEERGAGEYAADCDIVSIIEGVSGTGLVLNAAHGCRFKGTSEGNDKGVSDTSNCSENTFEELWCEANTTLDFELYGTGNQLINCKSLSASLSAGVSLVTAQNTRFIGGYMRTVDMQVGSDKTVFVGTRTSDNASLGFKGVGSYKSFGCTKSDIADVITGDVSDIVGESGTFTPVLDAGVSSPTVGYSVQEGVYNRIGRTVNFSIRLALSSLSGGSGIAIITGLPFVASGSISVQGVNVGEHSNVSLAGGRLSLLAEIPMNQSYVKFNACGYSSPVASTVVDISEIGTTATITVSGSYIAAI